MPKLDKHMEPLKMLIIPFNIYALPNPCKNKVGVVGGLAEQQEHFRHNHIYKKQSKTQTYDNGRREQNKWRKRKKSCEQGK